MQGDRSDHTHESEPVSPASCYLEFAADLSSRFASITPDKMDEEIGQALQRMVGFFAVECCAIYRAPENHDGIELVQKIDPDHLTPASSRLEVPRAVPLILQDALGNKQTLCLRTPDDLPGAAHAHRAQLADCGIESLVLLPVPTSTAVDYLFLLASAHARQAWGCEEVSQIRMLAGILVNALCRSGMQKTLMRTTRDLSEAQRIYGVGSWEWDVRSGTIMAIDAVDRILGIKPATQAGFVELVHAADRTQLQNAIDNALFNNGSELLIEYRMRARRGDTRIVRSRFEVACTDTGPKMIGTFQDVTVARRSEQELQMLRSRYWHADRVAHIGVLVASLAHELSQPLTAILSNAQAGLRFLSQEPVDQREICDIMKDIVADNRRARQIIDALRGMIRGKKTGRARTDAGDIAREVLAISHGEFVAQQVEVKLTCAGACFVLADKAQIEQVLLNLMLNSMEAMRNRPADERHVVLQVKRHDEHEVQVSVADTGTGIEQDQLGAVFEAFWTTKVHGLGMGLAVCRSIIEAHGGRIWAERNEDRGAAFLFRLPSVQ